jgi:predicted AlkP superfamily phosphohydrolase/phosphomutase
MTPLTACLQEATAERGKSVVILGFDGMHWGLVRKMMAQGRLPNLKRLARQGMGQPLETSIPPLSPVAWSTFITGMDPSGHGIFEFTHRDPRTLNTYYATSRAHAAGAGFALGGWRLPLGQGKVELLRHGTPFWQPLHDRGIPTTIIRMPANYPPSGTADRELSGMGVPDLLGSLGSYTFYSSYLVREERTGRGGHLIPLEVSGNVANAELIGPPNPLRRDPTELTLPFQLVVDPVDPVALLRVGGKELVLRVGEWSDWVPLSFYMAPTQYLHGQAIFYLRSVRPHVELFVDPIEMDPYSPNNPLSTPKGFAAELAEATGRFYNHTQPEQAEAAVDGTITRDEYLEQAKIVQDEEDEQFHYLLDRFDGGLFFHYWGYTDQVAHMVWRSLDPGHPTYDPKDDARFVDVLPRLYERADRTLGDALAKLGKDTTVVVMSDHGFTSWRRSFNLNTWLEREGYMKIGLQAKEGHLANLWNNVDWRNTRAYSMGFNDLYINLAGREGVGIVPPAEKAALVNEIGSKLRRATDPATGKRIVNRVFVTEEVFDDGPYLSIGPDAVLGFSDFYHASWESALGKLDPEVVKDNSGWTGDHAVDPAFVPGILFANHRLPRRVTGLKDLAAAILAEFGIQEFPERKA